MASLDTELLRSTSKKYEGSPYRLFFAAACAFLGPLSFGYVIGYSSPAIPILEKEGLLDKNTVAWFASLMTVGALAGGPFAGWCIEKIGRKKTIFWSSLPFILGWLFIATANSATFLLIGRFLCGFSSGMVTVCVPVYIAEISTKSLRGTLGAGVQLIITVGILVAYALGMKLKWNVMAFLGVIPATLTMLAMIFVPETPRWLIMQNRKTDALQALSSLRGPHTDVEDECRDIEEGIDSKESFYWSEFRRPELLRPLRISVLIMVFQQLSGINAIMFYTVSIFKSAGLENSEGATVMIGAVQVVSTFLAVISMDRAGRRKLLITAGTIMCITCFTFGLYYMKVSQGTPASSLGWLAVGSLILYIIGFSLGWGPIPMLIMSEIFPARARGAASGIAIFCNWFCAFLVTKEFIVAQEILGTAGTFWIFAAVCLSGVMYVWRYVPETKGKSLEDIELYFLGKSMLRI
ncbi:hypothetical protein CHS0354_003354 [Potamilus streckersoni]|uniref:Major facilitator superfamily (MFS) profile domain-containing protein n=1 Tax=Potamilus streckersoni TaxID=2493646 RepID=A0AAE0S522_9BIVA|nr:hypothetical protein CHS0354_003354 [Potamilus streckersoni]